jgi:competence protein ComGF
MFSVLYWKQTMIYTTLHRTLNIEQHKPHWKQTMIYRMESSYWSIRKYNLSLKIYCCVAQCLVFCVVLCRSLFVFSVVSVAQCLVFCVVLCRSLLVFSVVFYRTLHRTLTIEQHKPHWKQTMIYSTLHRTLNIEQHKPHWWDSGYMHCHSWEL